MKNHKTVCVGFFAWAAWELLGFRALTEIVWCSLMAFDFVFRSFHRIWPGGGILQTSITLQANFPEGSLTFHELPSSLLTGSNYINPSEDWNRLISILLISRDWPSLIPIIHHGDELVSRLIALILHRESRYINLNKFHQAWHLIWCCL